MDPKSEVRDFLTSRRARITPEQAGMTTFGQRRVPGLRREEVATIAGVSVDYYNRLERGNLSGASEGVLDAVADALALDEASERTFTISREPLNPPRERAGDPQNTPSGPACNGCSTRSPARQRLPRTDDSTP
jgi:transcriptional regulator with XRE-family HTH domain